MVSARTGSLDAMPGSTEARTLFRAFLRSGRTFPQFNISHYIQRRAREEFYAHAREADPARLQQLVASGREQLEVVKRQALVYGLYGRKIKNVLVRALHTSVCTAHAVAQDTLHTIQTDYLTFVKV